MAGKSSKYWGANAWRNQAEKEVRRSGPLMVLLPLLFLIAGLAVGYFCVGALQGPEDGFSLRGDKRMTVQVGETLHYTEEGYLCSMFGRDLSDCVEVQTNLSRLPDGGYTADASAPGVYYISYTCTDPLFYHEVRLVRTFHVLAEGGES